MDVFEYGIDVFDFFFGRVGVVVTQVANAAEFTSDAEVEADALGMANVEIAVGLGRKAGVDLPVFRRDHVGCNDGADEVTGSGGGVRALRSTHVRQTAKANKHIPPCPMTESDYSAKKPRLNAKPRIKRGESGK